MVVVGVFFLGFWFFVFLVRGTAALTTYVVGVAVVLLLQFFIHSYSEVHTYIHICTYMCVCECVWICAFVVGYIACFIFHMHATLYSLTICDFRFVCLFYLPFY